MKKRFIAILILMFVIFLTACSGNKEHSLVISKLYTASSASNNIIELYNNSDNDLDLKNYSIEIYESNSTEVALKLNFAGKIKANEYFVIAGINFSLEEYKHLIDILYDGGNLPFKGENTIALKHKNSVIDILGNVGGLSFDFSRNLTLIRLGETNTFKPYNEYDFFNFIAYNADLFEYLKNDDYEIKTLDDLLKGPMLEDRYKEMPFADPNNNTVGYGGAVLVSVTGIADGDTAFFTSNGDFSGGSVRYFHIDTPEVDGSNVSAEPWGYVASKLNKEYILSGATTKEIYVQSIPGYSLTETYGRSIGLVWINGYLSQFITVAEGLSNDVDISYKPYDFKLHYKGIPYLTFLRFAEKRAKDNGWGMKGFPGKEDGEKSPDWNYQANRLATTNPVWQPHLPMPWE